jgi:hypothetical protein
MQTFAQYALPGTILASAVGAVVLCIVLFLYGFRSDPEDEGPSPFHRLLVIRLGHALAAACFAAAVMLSTVALIDQRRVAASAPSPIARPTDVVRRLEAQVRTLERRLAATEYVVHHRAAVESPTIVESRPAAGSPVSRPRSSTASSARRLAPSPLAVNASDGASPPTMREQGEAMSIRPAASEAVVSPTSTNALVAEDLGAKFREDWRSVKRGFQRAGDGLSSGVIDLGRRLKGTFVRGD